MVEQQKMLSLISSHDYCRSFSRSQTSEALQLGLELEQNLSSGFLEENFAVVANTTPRWHYSSQNNFFRIGVPLTYNKQISNYIFAQMYSCSIIQINLDSETDLV